MDDHQPLARRLLDACHERGLMLVTAESCTGGGIATALTEIPGSSAVVDRGFVTYSNEAKREMLGVSPLTLDDHGAVSEETAREMAIGALERSHAGLAISVTGIAGPDGGSAEKPVGLVWFGIATENGVTTDKRVFANRSRSEVRSDTVATALELAFLVLNPVPAG